MRHGVYAAIALLSLFAPLSAQISPRAAGLQRDLLVFDAHVHAINRQLYHGGDIGTRASDGQFDLPRAREGGLKAMLFSIFINEQYYPARLETRQTLRLIDLAIEQVARNKATIEFAPDASAVERIVKTGKIAAVLDLEGGFNLDGDLGVLRNLHRLGLRSAQLVAHNWTNSFADSCCAPAKWHGLNAHGREVVREMNRLGMLINVSHASDETLEQTIDLSSSPIAATHHGMRALNDIPRLIPDRLLKKLAAKGGVMGIQIGNEFHNVRMFNYRTQQAGKPFWDTREIGARESQMSIEAIDRMVAPSFPMVGLKAPDELLMSVDEWVGVVDRAIQIAGEDHIMLGTDFDGGPTLPRGMRDIRDLPMITDAMLRRGYSEQRIRKFMGGNLLRVYRMVTEKR